jgi:hypothetical protein
MLISCLAAVGFLASSLPASAANDGTFAAATTANCTDNPCTNNLQLVLDLFAAPFDSDGGGGQLPASASLTTPGQGAASTAMTLAGDLNTPLAIASAQSLFDNTIAVATSVGVQGYRYTGSGETLSLSVELTGDIVDPLDTELTGLTALIMLFRADDASLSLPDDLTDSVGLSTLLLDIDALRANPAVSLLELEAQENGSVKETGVVELDVMTNDDLFLVSQFGASAVGVNASAISDSTLLMGFNTAALVPTLVPVPAAAWLFGSAILFLAGISQTKRLPG